MSQQSDYEAYQLPENTERTEAEKLEVIQTMESVPVIEEVLAWLDECIADDKGEIENISISTPAEDVKTAVLLNQRSLKRFNDRKKDFEHRFSKYLKRGADAA